jgi:hypothetical protein
MELDIRELLAGAICAAGGEVVIDAEVLNEGFQDKVVAINYDQQTDRFHLTLVDVDDVEYEEE